MLPRTISNAIRAVVEDGHRSAFIIHPDGKIRTKVTARRYKRAKRKHAIYGAHHDLVVTVGPIAAHDRRIIARDGKRHIYFPYPHSH
jgi:hypothetical protein